jgi:prolyl-tRNA synthetase
MRQSHLFTTTRKEAPKDEVSKNAQLLIRGGYIHKEMAGVYSLLPLGVRVMNNVCNVLRTHMNALGGQEVLLTALQDPKLWEKTNRWDDKVVDNWFKTKLKNDSEVGLGFTHEEQLTNLMKDFIRSFRDLPVYAYQIQTKFRNEARAKSGIMRGREFLMKDLYSFCKNEKEQADFYAKAKEAYLDIFEEIGLGDKTYVTYASGGSFSKYSHEFQTITPAGEDNIYICDACKIAVNEEIIEDTKHSCPECSKGGLRKEKAVEVGNIFNLGTKFSDALGLTYKDDKGVEHPVIMGSYGIGPGRLIGTIVETLADEKGIIWPASVAPFKVHLIRIDGKVKEGMDISPVQKYADALYGTLNEKGITALYDDRDARAGEKFADADLLGIPLHVIVSEKTLTEGKVELKDRATGSSKLVTEAELMKLIPA